MAGLLSANLPRYVAEAILLYSAHFVACGGVDGGPFIAGHCRFRTQDEGQTSRMALRPRILFLVAALVCFIIGLLVALGTFGGTDWPPWLLGGLTAWVLAGFPYEVT